MRRCGACSREIPGEVWAVRALHDDGLTRAEAVTECCSLACVEAILAGTAPHGEAATAKTQNRREKRMAIPVRTKHVMMSNDQRQLLVLEGTPGEVVAVEGSKLRPMLRVVFTSAIALDAQPLTTCDRPELVVAPEELVLDAVAAQGTPGAGDAGHDRASAEVPDTAGMVGR